MAAEKTAGQDLAPLDPSVLFRSPTSPPPSLIGFKKEVIMKRKIKKTEGEVEYIAQANCGSQLRSVETHAAAQGSFYISKYFPPPPPPPPGFRSSAHSPDDVRSSKCKCYK